MRHTTPQTSQPPRGRVLPADDDWAALAVDETSLSWRRGSDIRVFAAAGYALALQVAHPTVGAGVSQLSQYREDPIGRFQRTSDFTNQIIYGGPEGAARMGKAVRDLHKHVKGVRDDGERYHALEPEAYAWVHATGAEAIVKGHEHFGIRFTEGEREDFWAEWRRIGRFLGIRWRDLPETWVGFESYRDEMLFGRLEHTVCLDEVWESMENPILPRRIRELPGPGPELLRRVIVHGTRLNTVGMMSPLLRKRLGFSWSRAEEAEFQLNGMLARAATPVMPASLKCTGPGYAARRGEAIAAGKTASLETSPHLVA
ncbi:MAG: oxygenase MpaB family protein [Baekduiaceae bacterium]